MVERVVQRVAKGTVKESIVEIIRGDNIRGVKRAIEKMRKEEIS